MLNVSSIVQAEVTQRLTNAKEAASRAASFHSHEDLARKLQVVFFVANV